MIQLKINGILVIAFNKQFFDKVYSFSNFHSKGPTLPVISLFDSVMTESPDGGVLIFGGQNGDIPDKIIELRARANSWETLNQKLKNPHYQHTVIPIPNYHED